MESTVFGTDVSSSYGSDGRYKFKLSNILS